MVPQALCEPEEEEDVETFLSTEEGRDRRKRRTWLLCVSSRQPEIQVSTECTHTLECRAKKERQFRGKHPCVNGGHKASRLIVKCSTAASMFSGCFVLYFHFAVK